ncbi:MAG: peptidylprolyl isomerase [Melioribacter sp.]|uniref:peptidylprolyl isomerase n=1 Tax=Melioribacter sp. TaxID=2052167 RepID=UPI003BD0F827
MSSKFVKILSLIFIIVISACSAQNSKIVVAEFGDNEITLDEFQKAYEKNAALEKDAGDSLDSYKNFLDLYVNYRMKLRDAWVRGYYQDEDLQKELTDYKVNIGAALYYENEIIKPGIERLYDKRKNEFKVAHIMLVPDSGKTVEDIIALGKELIRRINNGEDFAALANAYSKDKFTNNKGGVIGYITAGDIPFPEIEDAIYATAPGSVYPEPVKSNFAYHVLKILEKQPRRYMIRIRHIMASVMDSNEVVDTAASYNKILEVNEKLNNGGDFEELAREYSDDKFSSKRGGDLGFIARGRMVREFEDAAFQLKVGERSPIVKTRFGYHIIEATDEKPTPPIDEIKEELKNIYQKTRYNYDKSKFIDSLKQKAGFTIVQSTIDKILENVDSMKMGDDYWTCKIHNEFGNMPVFKLNGRDVIVDSLFNFMITKKKITRGKVGETIIDNSIDEYSDELAVRDEVMNYDKVNAQFASLMDEYEKGVYLFKILDEEVWSKVNIDSTMAKNYYEKNKENFKLNDRVQYKQIQVRSDSLANVIYGELVSGADFDSLASKYTRSTIVSELVEVKNDGSLPDKALELGEVGKISEPFKFKGNWVILKLIKHEPARIKTFDEARNEITGILQEKESKRLENEYIERLKKLYHPEYHYDKLAEIVKK